MQIWMLYVGCVLSVNSKIIAVQTRSRETRVVVNASSPIMIGFSWNFRGKTRAGCTYVVCRLVLHICGHDTPWFVYNTTSSMAIDWSFMPYSTITHLYNVEQNQSERKLARNLGNSRWSAWCYKTFLGATGAGFELTATTIVQRFMGHCEAIA